MARGRRAPARAIAIGTMIAVVFAGACRSEPNTRPSALLRAALAEGAPTEQFRFVYNAAGTRVNDCFEPNRSFVGDVDRPQGVLVLRPDTSSAPMAYVTGGRAVLSANLFRSGSLPTQWVTTSGPVDGPLRRSLLRVLGTGLAGYVVDGLLPPDGTDFAQDGLEVAKEVTRLPGRDGARRFALRLDRGALAGADDQEEPLLEDPILEVWVAEGGNVQRISVRPGRPEKPLEDDLEIGGWTIDYLPAVDEVAVPDLGPVTELSAVDAGALVAPLIQACELPLSADP